MRCSSVRPLPPTPGSAARASSSAQGAAFAQIEILEDRTDHARAQTNVETAISKYPDVGVFLGLWSYNAHFIAEEVAKFPELRKKSTVVTFDMDELAVDDLANGKIDATVCQNPYQMGYLAVRLLKAYILKDQKTIDEMLPAGRRYDRHRRASDCSEQGLSGQRRERDRHRRDEEMAGEQGAQVVVISP